jgi:4-amino-4-deoxy-L-arabinose transferase-like glycosyltransferase
MNKKIAWFFFALCIIYIIGFGIDTMDIDASQYASISREMLATGDYLHVHDLGHDYLDKPPFLFWISSFSMKIFGVNNFAYYFPSFLFALSALFSTYQLCLLYYKKEIALLSAIILATCEAFFLINHDVRTDTILMGWVIFSLWQLAAWYKNNKLFHFVLAFVGIAGGMLTKGPIALMVPIFAFGTHFILQRNFKAFFRWQYILGVLIILLLLTPMCIGLYEQFDLHPEKIVNAKKGVSGLRFFFWTQSFGRITGESEWNSHSNIFFLLQNMLWSFLPWILFFLIAIFLEVKQLIQQKLKLFAGQEWITTGGFLVTYLALGSSKYQLPHYIYVVFPLAAIVTAKFIYALLYEHKYPKLAKGLQVAHFIIFTLLWLALILLLSRCFDSIPFWVPVVAAVFFGAFLFLSFYKRLFIPTLLATCIFSIASINLFLNYSFYPSLLRYQMGNTAGRWVHTNHIPTDSFFCYQYVNNWSLAYYAQAVIKNKDSVDQILNGDWILMPKNKLPDLDEAGKRYEIVYQNEDFHVSGLTLKFLKPATRDKEVQVYVIVKIKNRISK